MNKTSPLAQAAIKTGYYEDKDIDYAINTYTANWGDCSHYSHKIEQMYLERCDLSQRYQNIRSLISWTMELIREWNKLAYPTKIWHPAIENEPIKSLKLVVQKDRSKKNRQLAEYGIKELQEAMKIYENMY